MEKKRYTEEQRKFLKTKLAIETRVDDEGRRRVSVEQMKNTCMNFNELFGESRSIPAIRSMMRRCGEDTPYKYVFDCLPKKTLQVIPTTKKPVTKVSLPKSEKALVNMISDLSKSLRTCAIQAKTICEEIKGLVKDYKENKAELKKLCEVRKAIEKFQKN